MTKLALLLVAGLLAAAPEVDARQIQSRPVQRGALPRQAAIRGNLVLAREWTDRGGRNFLVLSRTPEATSRARCDGSDRCIDRELYAYHYVQRGNTYALLWSATDFVRGCEFDLELKFNPRSVAVTDLDADGTAETSFMYARGCRSDVSQLEMKLIMHEGATKYALRGSSDLMTEIGAQFGTSRMTIDPSFNAAPPSFRAFAVQQWNRFKREMTWPADG
ncbi:M949_RS01915 family surface polysaccharide biosynthesis protein [Longimicrobium terrae]|uniref:Uncharacterized protein n=1 Tax=Longimicrobium terrae TaxID=1639882 RepID=A0A841H2E8_9BACT|nr:hypothetical protein [Longimicrobium terrae]MBB4637709.1 hypothetical protein [Longimicrobium terrae]MBB6072106.1 hypothetical protein [Longimicrobium terrae]NNC29811.1 hypothetical protein [Longimicrobium terrae]